MSLFIYRFPFNLFLFLIIYPRKNVYPLTGKVYHNLGFTDSKTCGVFDLPSIVPALGHWIQMCHQTRVRSL